MVTSLGTFSHEYVFQGLIICSPREPLLARVLGEAMMTPQSELASKAKGKGNLTFCRQFYQTLKKGAQLNKLEPGWVDAGPYGWVYLLKEDKLVTDKALQVMQLTKPIPDTDDPFVSLPFDGHITHSGNKHPAQTEHWLLATRCWGWNQGWKEDRARADTAFHQAAKGHRAQASAAQVVACRPLDGDLAVEMQVLRLSEAGRVSNLVCCK